MFEKFFAKRVKAFGSSAGFSKFLVLFYFVYSGFSRPC